jgi:hypothetical protein
LAWVGQLVHSPPNCCDKTSLGFLLHHGLNRSKFNF